MRLKATAANERFGVSRGVARGQFCGILEVCRPSEPLCSPTRTPSRRDVARKRKG
jgi:hypothetical protein